MRTTIGIGLVAVVLIGCTGAFQGATWNLGKDDRRVAGAKLYDQHCGGCHDPQVGQPWHAKKKIAPVIASVVAPDLLSSAWRAKLLAQTYDGDRPLDDITIAEWRASFMHTLFSHACWYGRERWPNGDRVRYAPVNRTTLDGLPIPVPITSDHQGEQPVVVMPPCGLDDVDLDAIRDWITCSQYPGTSSCKRMR